MATRRRAFGIGCAAVLAGGAGVALAGAVGGEPSPAPVANPASDSVLVRPSGAPEAILIPKSVHADVDLDSLRFVARQGLDVILTGSGARVGFECTVYIDTTRASVGCHRPQDLPKAGGIGLRAFRPDGSSAGYVYLPLGAEGGRVTVGGRSFAGDGGRIVPFAAGPDDDAIIMETPEGEERIGLQPGTEALSP